MGTSPNNVTNYVLLTVSGSPGSTAQTVGGSSSNSKKRKRDLTLVDWPTYNGTLALTFTRSDYQIAEAPDGVMIITRDNSENPIAMFDSKENSWLNASRVLGGGAQTPLQTSTSTLSSVSVVTPTSTTSPSSTAAAAPGIGDSSSKSKTLMVLGAPWVQSLNLQPSWSLSWC